MDTTQVTLLLLEAMGTGGLLETERELRRRGVSVREAWHTSKSAHGPLRLSKTPALALALPAKQFGAAESGGELEIIFIEPPST